MTVGGPGHEVSGHGEFGHGEFGRGEFGRLARLAPHLAGDGPGVPLGVGDDAAVVAIGGASVVVCVDTLVEGVHFRRDLSTPADVGWKALAVNVSDIAAMGAVARAAVVALHRPPTLSEADVDQLYEGMAEAAQRWGVAVVGGDTSTAGEWAVAVTVLGEVARAAGPGSGSGSGARSGSGSGEVAVVRRSGARVGDVLVLSGRLGAGAAALWADERGRAPDPVHLAAHRRPQALPLTGVALARAGAVAMVDVSDGLGADARHLCEASGVAAEIDRTAVEGAVASGVEAVVGEGWLDVALGGGEDFALLAALPPDRVEGALAAVTAAGETTAVVVGVLVAGAPAVTLVGPEGRRSIDRLGYDHG